MVTTTFHFVDHAAAPGRESRRAIRSHVMKGKNVGKVRIPKRPAHQAPRAVVKPYYNLPPPAPTTTKLSPEKDDRHSTTSSSPEAKTPDTSSSITTITTTTTTSSNTSRAVARAPRTHRTLRLNPRSPAQVANELSGLASPGDLTPQTRDFVIHFLRHVGRALYPIQFCSTGPDPEFLVWFRYMLFDEACKYHVPCIFTILFRSET